MATKLPTEFEYGGNRYQIGVLDIFAQADLAALLLPLLGAFAELAKEDGTLGKLSGAIQAGDDGARKQAIGILFGNLERMTNLVAKMPREQRHEILEICFSCVLRQTDGAAGWQPIWVPEFKRLRYAELNSLPAALSICGRVIEDKLESFFAEGA